MNEKYTGYGLLVVGVTIMFFSAIQIIFVFTGRAEPIKLFQPSEATTENPAGSVETNNEMGALFQQLGIDQKLFQSGELSAPGFSLIDANEMFKLFNLITYFFIMQFLLSFGYKLSSLGVQLLRPIRFVQK